MRLSKLNKLNLFHNYTVKIYQNEKISVTAACSCFFVIL